MEDSIKKKIESVINCFETGSPAGDYSDVTLLHDGPNQRLQVTYGKAGVTEYGGNLKVLLTDYVETNGKYADFFAPYLKDIGKGNLSSDKNFIQTLKLAGNDKFMIMAQDHVFDAVYWQPAYKFFVDNGFTTNLAMLTIYDSYIHSGSVPMFLRNRFAEKTPKNGGNEKQWIARYIETRKQWLKFHSNPILRKTTYRMDTIQKLINNNDWSLQNSITTDNGCKVS